MLICKCKDNDGENCNIRLYKSESGKINTSLINITNINIKAKLILWTRTQMRIDKNYTKFQCITGRITGINQY